MRADRNLAPAESPNTPRPERASFSAAGWTWVLTATVAAALIAVGWPILAAVHGLPVVVAMVLSVLQAAAVVVVVCWPRAGAALGAVAALATALAVSPAPGLPWPWPITTLLAYVALVLVLSLCHGYRVAAGAWLAGTLVSVIAVVTLAPGDDVAWWTNAIPAAGSSLGAFGVGNTLRLLWANRGQLVRERQLTAAEESKRRELQQRNRIAQELHDVVAHSLSVISVQATTAPYRLPGMDEPTRGEFDSIAGSSRRALTEMRGLLAVLRGDDAAETAPQPTIADIPDLVANTRSSGARVDLEIDPELLPLGSGASAGASGSAGITSGGPSAAGDWSAVVPPATGLTAYRLVQEAVSNALRHAPGAAIRVQVTVGDLIGVRVVNGPASRTLAVPAPGAGLGLKGLRERVTALGGTVTAGPTPDGGFTVKARLPL